MTWAQHYRSDWCDTWPRALPRLAAWWRGEPVDGPIVRYGYPRQALPSPSPSPAPASDWERMRTDLETAFRRAEAMLSNIVYRGDAVPGMGASIGHSIGSFLGCQLRHDPRTIWTEPCMAAIDDSIDVTAWRHDARWAQLRTMLSHFVRESRGRCGVGYYIGGVISAISLMRGTTEFLADLAESPRSVEALRDRLLPQWFAMAEELERLLPPAAGQWLPFLVWAPGRCVFCECDVSSMFSEAMFRRFVVPEVRAMAKWAEFSFYHLDGPGADRHLDALLEIPELTCIQWIRGTNGGRAVDWLPLLRRIQAAGKHLYVECPLSELEPMLDALSPARLMLEVEGCSGPRDAEAVERMLGRRRGES